VGAIAASSCCIDPLALFIPGATGAWVGNLDALAAYQPYFIPLTLELLGIGIYLLYHKPQWVGVDDAACAPHAQPAGQGGLWSAPR
jgi:mercuric ion transport protein